METTTIRASQLPAALQPISPCLPALSLTNLPAAERKFQAVCHQLILLNNSIRELHVRYERAVKSQRRAQRYSLRMRLCSVEGLRNMFYEYATDLADRLDELEQEAGLTTDELIEAMEDQ